MNKDLHLVMKKLFAVGLLLGFQASAFAVTDPSQFDTVINIPPDIAPVAVSGSIQVNLFDGGVLPAGFEAGISNVNNEGVQLNLFGGDATGSFRMRDRSSLNISGGEIGGFWTDGTVDISITGGHFLAPIPFDGGQVTIDQGLFDGVVYKSGTADVTINGGTFNQTVNAGSESSGILTVNGGVLNGDLVSTGADLVVNGGEINGIFSPYTWGQSIITGGSFNGEFHLSMYSHSQVYVRRAWLNGVEITSSLSFDEFTRINDREVTLSAVLADGSAFEFELNPAYGSGDWADPEGRLDLRLVPEPGSAIILLLGLGVVARHRR